MYHEVIFRAKADGINIRVMDASHVSMVNIKWDKSAFVDYKCDGDEIFCVNTERLIKLLKGDKSKAVEVTTQDGNVVLSFDYGGKKGKKYEMRTIEIEKGDEMPLPKLRFTCKIKMKTERFLEAIKEVGLVSDDVSVTANGGIVAFKGVGDDGKAEVVYWRDDETDIELDGVDEVKSLYSVKFMDVIKEMNTDTIEIQYASKMPLKIVSDDGKGLEVEYYLAPKAE
jgi:proliferating cell nuclear antigen